LSHHAPEEHPVCVYLPGFRNSSLKKDQDKWRKSQEQNDKEEVNGVLVCFVRRFLNGRLPSRAASTKVVFSVIFNIVIFQSPVTGGIFFFSFLGEIQVKISLTF
jgi:hypothetical protein